MDDQFETQKAFRYALSSEGLDSFRVQSVETFLGPRGGVDVRICLTCFEATDLSQHPIGGDGACPHTASLKLLDAGGGVNEEYALIWNDQTLLPFVRLNYDSSGPVVQAVILHDVRIKRR